MIPRIATATAAILLTLTLASCGSPDAPSAETPAPSPAAVLPSESAAPVTPTPEPSKTPVAPECDTIIPEGVVAALTDAGWTYEHRDFEVGGVILPSGLLCIWGDFTVAGDHVQLYGLSEISDGEAATAVATLTDQGWTRTDRPEGIFIAEDPAHAFNGYPMAYLFGDGWVKFSDVESVFVVDWPS